jgi:hypothetical protein
MKCRSAFAVAVVIHAAVQLPPGITEIRAAAAGSLSGLHDLQLASCAQKAQSHAACR